MGKTQAEIALYKEIMRVKKILKQDVTEVYACFIKILYDRGMSIDEIADIVNESQQLWTDVSVEKKNMIQWVEETVGIDLESI